MSIPDVVVLIPGILGSALKRNGHDVWNLSGGAALRALFTLGHDITDLALKEDPPDADDLGDGITADRLLQDVHLIPGLWKIDGYSRIAATLCQQFELTPGRNYFEFPYDWRRDNRVAARKLERQAGTWLKDWRASSGNSDAKLILIGHSMGGLVARHFLELLEGWKITKALITFGTPYRGSLNALDALANGIRKGPLGIINFTELVRSLTAVYQLLPTFACYDAGDSKLVHLDDAAAIPHLDPQKVAAALAFHKSIQTAVDAHRKQDAYRDQGYQIFPVIGIEQKTFQSARRFAGGVEALTTYKGEDYFGDGTVPRVSARPTELDNSNAGMFAATAHASLQNADAVLTQVHGAVTNLYVPVEQFRVAPVAGPPVQIGIDIDDVYWTDEPVTIDVLPVRQSMDLVAVVTDIEDDTRVAHRTFRADTDAPHPLEFTALSPGAYRITIAGDARVQTVTDVFAVAEKTCARQ